MTSENDEAHDSNADKVCKGQIFLLVLFLDAMLFVLPPQRIAAPEQRGYIRVGAPVEKHGSSVSVEAQQASASWSRRRFRESEEGQIGKGGMRGDPTSEIQLSVLSPSPASLSHSLSFKTFLGSSARRINALGPSI